MAVSSIRILFLITTLLVSTCYAIALAGLTVISSLLGLGSGLVFGLAILSLEPLLRRIDLRSLNIAVVGLLVGFLLGQGLWWIVETAISEPHTAAAINTYRLLHISILLATCYVGMVTVARSAEQLHISIPFVRFTRQEDKRRDIIADASVLTDSRLIDLAASGLVNDHLIVPRFILRDLHRYSEGDDETLRSKARRTLAVIKKLEALPNLGLRYTDADFPEIKDPMRKIVSIARYLNAQLLTAEVNRIQQSGIEGINIINIHALSNALKPIMQAGETIDIKVQRLGKEPMQGVGYLDDGTMVVVNGGGDFIGDTIKAQVLSVKHTSSGRMIFCNCMQQRSAAAAERTDDNKRNHASSQRDYFLV